ncbi:MAG: excinuclease ABC subunit UvrC [Victivallales bacterium]|nr:excinuclease ABC subunit UvrC [Victivallales bacterium]
MFRAQDVPKSPGVYVYRNQAGVVIYVGKARNLRNRMSQYFRASSENRSDPRRRALIHSIASYEIFPVETEAEALLLETNFIKQYEPRYNVLMRDDKRFMHIVVDMTEEFPRLQLARIRRDDRRIYIGPFPQAYALRETVQFLNRHYALRTCQVANPDAETHRHCLEETIRGCLCPCLGKVTREKYAERIQAALGLFKGEGAPALLHELDRQMRACSAHLEFEEAARLRDIIGNLKSVLEPARRFVNQTMITRGSLSNPLGMLSLKEALDLQFLPRHIECFDMANIAGTLAVGSMVYFRDGRPDTSQYRRFKIRSETARDDTAFMEEVLTRRYTRVLAEKQELPDLIVLDGGLGQVHTAGRVFASLGLTVPYCGLAKQMETIVVPEGEPILLPRSHPGLRLLQAIRDEAHRWANGYNRLLRNKRIYDSILDDIPGIGAVRKVQLLKAFGSVRNLAKKTPEEIRLGVPGIGAEMARQLHDYLQSHLANGTPDTGDSAQPQ